MVGSYAFDNDIDIKKYREHLMLLIEESARMCRLTKGNDEVMHRYHFGMWKGLTLAYESLDIMNGFKKGLYA